MSSWQQRVLIVSITRDANGQVTAVTMKKTATAAVETVATAISFQPLSNLLKSVTLGNGLQTNASYVQEQ
jgi:hypothetical protein